MIGGTYVTLFEYHESHDTVEPPQQKTFWATWYIWGHQDLVLLSVFTKRFKLRNMKITLCYQEFCVNKLCVKRVPL